MSAESRTPSCPYCGFTVFNPRYPKCEKCGEQLPESVVHSKEAVAALLEQERRERERKQRGAGSGTPSTGSDPGTIGDITEGPLDSFEGLSDLDL